MTALAVHTVAELGYDCTTAAIPFAELFPEIFAPPPMNLPLVHVAVAVTSSFKLLLPLNRTAVPD
jgi:hypothetical protein